MRTVILEKLREIETMENVRILFAVESGSRAWGFASPDSDYDVRFVYVRPMEFYLRLEQTRDVIEWQLDETLDINGWDLQKLLRLLYRSNPTIFEWNSSPVVYKTTAEWERISPVINRYFQSKKGLYHYLSMAKNNYREYLKGDMVKRKKYFYVLRPLLACRWILEKGTPPPMGFSELVNACLDEALVPVVNELVRMKQETPELGVGPRIDALNDYLERSVAEVDEAIKQLPHEEPSDWKELNRLFLQAVGV